MPWLGKINRMKPAMDEEESGCRMKIAAAEEGDMPMGWPGS